MLQCVRGVKRKRPHDKELEEDKEAKLRRKLHHAVRELCKVVKKARTFEVQKTLKKLKDARRRDPESDVTKDLVAQMEILKILDYDRLAHSALVAKLNKDKNLSADLSIQAISVELLSHLVSPVIPGSPTAKVQSRILSSKVLALELTSVVETLRTFLHHPPFGPEGIGIREISNASRSLPNISEKTRIASGNTSGDEVVIEVDDGWESGTVGDSVAGVTDDDTSSEDFRDADFPSKVSEHKSPRSQGSMGQSEFLPSLSVGFTRGESGGEFSDSEANLVDGIKKNRRGQRARRAIWEKKFGKNANHIKRRRQRGTECRHPGSAPVDRRPEKGNPSSRSRRAPVQSRALNYGREQAPGSNAKKSGDVRDWNSTREFSDLKGGHRGKQGEQLLHPSWEAKKKHKSASIVPSQGTKIVFSES